MKAFLPFFVLWARQAYLKAGNSDAGDSFGTSVAVSGETVVVGAFREASNATGVNGDPANNLAHGAGAAYVFTRSGTVWTQQAYLKAGNSSSNDWFGGAVGVSDDTVVVGAWGESSNATVGYPVVDAGAAYIFMRSGMLWSQQAYLKAVNTGVEDYFGSSVSVSGDTVVVGARSEDSNATGVNGNAADNSASNAGAAYVYTRTGAGWALQAYLKASNSEPGDNFGHSVAVSGDTVVVGALFEDSNATGVNGNPANNAAPGAGAVYVFTRRGTAWMQQAYLKAATNGEGDLFGSSVAVSSDTVVVGAIYEDSSATGVNGNPADNSTSQAGAAYVFTGVGPPLLTPLEQWRQLHFGISDNTGDAADTFDFDQDGLVNLLEWAVGKPPKHPNPYQPVVVRNGAELEFRYSRSLAAFNAGTGYAVEYSGSLAAETWQTTGVTQNVLSTEGDVQTVRATVPAGTERRYLRLRVTAPQIILPLP